MAYIGPGMGAGAMAVVFGVLGSIMLALFAIIYIRQTHAEEQQNADDIDAAPPVN